MAKKNLACLLVLVTAIVVMMAQGQRGLAASDSKYCKACNATLQCPDSCPRFNQGSSKSLCNIDCKTCTTECKKSNAGTSGGSSPPSGGSSGDSSSSGSSSGGSSPSGSSSSSRSSSGGSSPSGSSSSSGGSGSSSGGSSGGSSPSGSLSPSGGSSSGGSSPPSGGSSSGGSSGGGSSEGSSGGSPSGGSSGGSPSGGSSSGGSSGGSSVGSSSGGSAGGCNEIGAVCKDPRFIGGDGILFYFHGKSNEDFCIVSDTNFHINGHFIGKRVEGRPRDFTWVQAIGILYGFHKVSIRAKKVARWDDDVDQLEVSYDGSSIFLDELIGESWESPLGDFRVLRTKDVNSVEIQVYNLMKVSINVTYVDEEDNKIHNYGINSEDCFAHLDLLFTFFNLSSQVDGVLGQTYKQTYKSLVKVGVPMPTMGGYEKFKSSSLFSSDCQVGVFDASSFSQTSSEGIDILTSMPSMSCTSQGESGIVCCR